MLGLVTLDNGLDHTRPNTFGPKSLVALNTAYDAALADDAIDAIAVTGKQFILCAGADLSSLQASGAAGIRTIAELGHAVFRKISGAKPSFGFINGLALGGGWKSRCTPTTARSSTRCRPWACPRSCWASSPAGRRLPAPQPDRARERREGVIENPLNNGKVLKGNPGVRSGHRRRRVQRRRLPGAVPRVADKVLTGEITVTRPEIDRGQAWDDAVAKASAFVAGKTSGTSPPRPRPSNC